MHSVSCSSITPKFVTFVLLSALGALLLGTISLESSSAANTLSESHAAIQQQDDDVVRVNTDLVLVNATVLDRSGKFVEGLKRGDFHLFEDGTRRVRLTRGG